MTAHRQKDITITPELVEAFRGYHRREPAWGILHVQFGDENLDCSANEWRDCTDEERYLIDAYNKMTVAQRSRLLRKVENQTERYRRALAAIAETCVQCPDTAQFAARVLDGSAEVINSPNDP